MTKKGQIVEIPATASCYKSTETAFHSKKDELTWRSASKTYSLFDGILVGEHHGVEHFKIGQRKGINVGGKKEPLYVIAVDVPENRLFVGAGENHPGLLTDVVRIGVENLALAGNDWPQQALEAGLAVQVDIEGSEEPLAAKLYHWEGRYFLEFDRKLSVTIKEYIRSITTN